MMTGFAVHLSESSCKPALIIANLCASPEERVSLRPVSAVHAFHQETKSATVFERVANWHSQEYRNRGKKPAKITIKRMLIRFSTVFVGIFSLLQINLVNLIFSIYNLVRFPT